MKSREKRKAHVVYQNPGYISDTNEGVPNPAVSTPNAENRNRPGEYAFLKHFSPAKPLLHREMHLGIISEM